MRRSQTGSSPLTRGKRRVNNRIRRRLRLIPAHAGKTQWQTGNPPGTPAHPRSRGENTAILNGSAAIDGSSPLTRGKLSPSARAPCCQRLIPAHAGKTAAARSRARRARAHPRSRGENGSACSMISVRSGSSPLTRGKHRYSSQWPSGSRLIPAHAGKTALLRRQARNEAAHPRSRGENLGDAGAASCAGGSSPLTRGKRR